MSARVPVGPLAVLVGVVAGILAGEAAGPAAATGVLALAVVAVLAAVFVRGAPVRLAVAVVAFACSAPRRCSGRSTGSRCRRCAAAVDHDADARLVGTLVDDPDSSRFDARALVRVHDVSGRGAGGRRVLVTASGDVAGHLRLLSAGEGLVVRRVVRAAGGLRHPVALEARGRRVPRHRLPGHEPRPRDARPGRQRRPGAGARRLATPGAGRPGAARRVPPRRHPRRARRPHRAVPRPRVSPISPPSPARTSRSCWRCSRRSCGASAWRGRVAGALGGAACSSGP